MNEKNQISATTKLFGFIAEKAQSNRFSVILNNRFKAQGDDAMIIPMNIREDDLYFTVSNMRASQLKGAAIAAEYQKVVLEILDSSSELVQTCGYCDAISVVDGKLHGEIISADALLAYLEEQGARKIAVIGAGSLARALALSADTMQLHFYHEYVEDLMAMGEAIGRSDLDINRCAEGMAIDLSGYDAVVDACRMPSLEMLAKLPALSVDLRTNDVPSPLRQRCTELESAYTGYETLLPYLTQQAYDLWMKH